MTTLYEGAFAKVNLTLDVLGKREDGYHDLQSVMQTISIRDDVEIDVGTGKPWTLSCSREDLPQDEDNLAWKAAKVFCDTLKIDPDGIAIRITKRIPSGAGLGGGSADAAAALVGLNQLWQLELPQRELLALGARLGADVPFCIAGGCCRATGIGTELQRADSKLALHLVILKPCEGLLTREVFGGLVLDGFTHHPNTPGAFEAAQAGDVDALIRCMGNVLEGPAMAKRPQIAQALGELTALGALHARMSGSGSAVFGLFDSQERAAQAALQLRRRYSECYAAQSVSEGVQFV